MTQQNNTINTPINLIGMDIRHYYKFSKGVMTIKKVVDGVRSLKYIILNSSHKDLKINESLGIIWL